MSESREKFLAYLTFLQKWRTLSLEDQQILKPELKRLKKEWNAALKTDRDKKN